MIWAQAHGRVIGSGNSIPWHIPEDFAHFKAVTLGHTVVMGRKTWDSLPRRPLPGRRNVVITRQSDWSADGADLADSVENALADFHRGSESGDTSISGYDRSQRPSDVWIIGGGQIYTAALPFADVLEVTEIDLGVEGDALAPEIPPNFACTSTGEWLTSVKGPRFRHLRYVRG